MCVVICIKDNYVWFHILTLFDSEVNLNSSLLLSEPAKVMFWTACIYLLASPTLVGRRLCFDPRVSIYWFVCMYVPAFLKNY